MNRKLFNLAALVVMLITLMGLAGCDGQPAPSNQEIASPTGCFKSQGRYYDPKLKVCVQVTNQQQANELNAYRYVNQLADDGKVQDADFYIFLKTYVSIDKAESLWSELQNQGAEMIMLDATLPDDHWYDPESGMNIPKIWGGDGVSAGCGWMKRDDTPADTIQGMILEGIKTDEKERPRPQFRKAILEDHECRVYSMIVHAKPEVIRNFWNNHLDDVEGIQPLVDFLDKAMPQLGPMTPYKEGN